MSFVLVRVDDRLIHGQVTVAWGGALGPDRIILANDEVAGCDWKRDLYEGEDAMGARVTILSVDDFIAELGGDPWRSERAFLIVESPADLLRVLHGGLAVEEANIGGMHHAEGKRELLPYVFVDDADVSAMREIIALGTKLVARDVPQAQPHDLAALLDALDGS